MSIQLAENVEFWNHMVIIVLHTVALTTVGHYGVHKSHSQNHYCTLWDNDTKELHMENYIWDLVCYFITLLCLMGEMGSLNLRSWIPAWWVVYVISW